MGARGPKNQPTAVRERRGTKRKDRHSHGMELPPGTPEPPAFLDEMAMGEWARVVEQLAQIPGLLAKTDGAMLAQYCQSFSDYAKASRSVQEHGATYETDKGLAKNPMVTVMNEAAARMTRCAREFGFTPAARAGINIGKPAKQDKQGFFNGGLKLTG